MTGVRECQPEADGLRQHTPTPWRAETDGWYPWLGAIGILPHDGNEVTAIAWTTSGDNEEANAAFIVEAVNSHAALKSRVEEQARTIDLLEANARAQAKLLADTGRRAEELTKEVVRLRAGVQSIVDCRNPLTRSAVREACAEILDSASALSLEQEKSHG